MEGLTEKPMCASMCSTVSLILELTGCDSKKLCGKHDCFHFQARSLRLCVLMHDMELTLTENLSASLCCSAYFQSWTSCSKAANSTANKESP